MPLKPIDFKGVSDRVVYPTGDYNAITGSYKIVQDDAFNNGEGRDVVLANFKIDEEGEYDGKTVFHRWPLDADMLWLFKKDMVSLGIDPEAFDGEVDVEEMVKEFFGGTPVPVVLHIEQTTYTDKKVSPNVERPISNVKGMEPR